MKIDSLMHVYMCSQLLVGPLKHHKHTQKKGGMKRCRWRWRVWRTQTTMAMAFSRMSNGIGLGE